MRRRSRSPRSTDPDSTVSSPTAAAYRADHRRTSLGAVLASLPPVVFVLAVVVPASVLAVLVALVVGLLFTLVVSRMRSDDD